MGPLPNGLSMGFGNNLLNFTKWDDPPSTPPYVDPEKGAMSKGKVCLPTSIFQWICYVSFRGCSNNILSFQLPYFLHIESIIHLELYIRFQDI